MMSGKSGTSFQDKLTKQNEINRQMLVRELSKLEGNKKSDIRMLDTARQRFRCRYKKLGVRASASGAEAHGVEMYETHNPGFCYHCTGAIRKSAGGSLQNTKDTEASYEVVRKMLFTDGEVDVEKIICLHLLTAHVATNVEPKASVLDSNSSYLDKGKKQPVTGSWNKLLPCYIIDIQRDSNSDNLDDFTDHLKFHQDPHHDNETVRNFEKSYERYTRNNADIISALTANDRLARIAPKTLGKMPIISPHVYSLLSASHELRVKQAIAEGYTAKRYYNKRSNVDLEMLDGKSIADSFRLLDDDNDEDVGRSVNKITPNISAPRDWSSRPGFSKNPGIKSHSRETALGSNYKIDPSITMLKGNAKRTIDELIKTWRSSENETINDLVMIKPSYGILGAGASKTSSVKSSFRTMQQHNPAFSINSIDSMLASSRCFTKKYRKSIYLNSPVKHNALKNQEYKTVTILVNYQIQALVHSVLDVLGNVNLEKLKRIIETAKDFGKIREIFGRREIENFLASLMDQPLIFSPQSFVVSVASALEKIDTRLERLLEGELVATTLEISTAPVLEMIMREIHDNIFSKEKIRSYAMTKDFTDESKPNEMLILSKSEDSTSTKLIMENKNEMQIGNDGRMFDDQVPIKDENKNFASEPMKMSDEGIQVLNEIDKLEKKISTEIPGMNRNKNIEDPTNKITTNSEDKIMLNVVNSSSHEKSQFKPQKATQDPGYLDPDRVILRRMTNEQRILVGRMCAALKNRRINNEGLIRERTPLAALITPVLSRESIKILTRGTIYANKSVGMNKFVEEKEEQTAVRTEKLTGPVLAKVRRDVAEHETKRQLDNFFTQ